MPSARTPQKGALIIRGGRVVDQFGVRRADVAIEDGVIKAVDETIDVAGGAQVIDAAGCLVSPGLVDLHTHLREPGGEASETIETGARAAALGGYTAVVAMPNTIPAIDSGAIVRDVLSLAKEAIVHVAVAGAITAGRKGDRLAEIGEMASLGVRLFTDDGAGVQDGGLMRRALEYARDLGVTLAQHCEDASLARGGHMHEGVVSSALGIAGQPALAEEAMLARDLALVEMCAAPMHFLHLSTKGSVALISQAKQKGLPVTAEVTPHHLVLTDTFVRSFDPVFKVNPPLRTDDDVASLRSGCANGIFDAIATDHAPHCDESKELPFEEAPPGMLGLETALSLCFSTLSGNDDRPHLLDLQSLFALFCWKPAAIAGLDASHGGPIAAGFPANVCVFDPVATWVVEGASVASRSHNTPFAGRQLSGKVRHTIFNGEAVVIDAVAQR